MTQRRFTLMVAALCLIALTAAAAGETPEIRNAAVDTRSAADDLRGIFTEIVKRADDVVWIGYMVPQIPGHRSGCGDSRQSTCVCKLEREVSSYQTSDDETFSPLSRDMLVLYRVEGNGIERIRMFSDYCAIDAGGLTVYWLTDVDPVQSIALLESFVDREPSKRRPHRDVAGSAVCAIAMHDHPDAFAALKRFVEPDRRESLRESAVFWIGETGGADGVKVLQRILRDDRSTDVREQVTFALTLSDTPEALETLIDAARHDRESEVRKQAIFWLSQEGGDRATEVISDAIDNDPDSDVREQGVFALSQLPRDEGIPLLINAARTNRHAKVREQAVFWLSQRAGERVAETISDVIENDPDTDVKEQAVFALSQLPRDEGVPMLIKVARTNRNREVREQAIFWLGQSGDERALDFFEEVFER